MVPVVFLLGVFVAAAGEVEAEPGVDLVGVGGGFGAIVRIDFLGTAFLFVVCCCFVVENCGAKMALVYGNSTRISYK